MKTPRQSHGPVRGLRVAILGAAAASLALPVGTASASPAPLHISSTIGVPGSVPAGRFGPPIAAEAPDGVVYVATVAGGGQSVDVFSTTGARHLADRVTGVGAITALAADATRLYVGTDHSVSAYLRSNGGLAQRWLFSPGPRALSQVAVAGNRVWGVFTPHGATPTTSSLVELDPTSPVRVATINGVSDLVTIAAAPTAIYYVTAKSSTIVRLTNAGVRTTAKTHLTVNQTLSGPAAVQAEVLQGNHLIVRFAAGQGLDAVTYVYNATTLAGPGKPAGFNAGSLLGNTSLGLLETAAPDDLGCTSTEHPCLIRYAVGSGGAVAPALVLPYDGASAPLGPFPAVVVTSGTHQRVLRIS